MKQRDIVGSVCSARYSCWVRISDCTLLPARTLPNTPDPSFFPWINTILLGVLSVALLIQGILRPTKKGVMQSTLGTRTAIVALGLILLYLVAIPYFGFVLSSVPFFALFMVLHGERRKLWLLIGAAGIPIFLYNLFSHLFSVPLPRGMFLGIIWMTGDIFQGLAQASLPTSLLATSIGSLLGLVVGMIPGMTISTGIIIVLPLTFVMDPMISIALLLGLYVGGMMGGSFSAILLNIPGTPSASATAIDGYPMAARGEAGRALGTAIIASFVGGLFSFLCLFFIAPLLAEVALKFHAQDLFSLVFFGLTIICSFAARSLIKGFLSAVIGLLIVTIGLDPVMGTPRFTFGQVNMLAGIHFLTALIGLFAIPQLVENLIALKAGLDVGRAQSRISGILPRLQQLKAMVLPTSIGSVTGSFLGILPGVGGPDRCIH